MVQRTSSSPGAVRDAAARGSAFATACGQAVARARTTRRLSVMLIAYLVLTGLMGWRLVSIQVLAADEYRGLAERQTQRELELPAQRGKLYDRSGEPLAMSLAAATIYANPRVLADNDVDPSSVATALAPLLDRAASDVLDDLRSDSPFVYLARQLPRAVGDQVRALALPGIGVLEEPTRTYPVGELAAQVVGFAGVDNTGLSGLEARYEDVLGGEPGRLRLERAPGGLTISAAAREVSPPVPGTDLVLTLDRQIQDAAELALTNAVAASEAKGGSAVVLDVETGEVLAMASVPTIDPEALGDATPYARRNRAVTDIYEPGSVNKVITIAAAMEEGIVNPGTTFSVADQLQWGGRTFSDSHAHPTREMTVAEIIADSSNVGTIQIAERLGEQRLYDYTRKFGYASSTGIAFPGESAGLMPELEDWSASSLPTIAIGYGVSVTLLQVADVFNTIAAGGEWVAPTLVRGRVGPDGSVHPAPEPERRRVVSEPTADAVAQMLRGVVEEGTGAAAAVPGYTVGGKTGTARKIREDGLGYQQGAYIASFGGFAPVENPAVVVAVMIDEPRHGYYASATAAPVFSEIMSFTLQHRRVPPSQLALVPSPAAAAEAVAAGEAVPIGSR